MNFTQSVIKAGTPNRDVPSVFQQFRENELLRDPALAARHFLGSVILHFDYDHDKNQNVFATKYRESGLLTAEMFDRAVNEEVLLRALGVLLVFAKIAPEEYFLRFFEIIVAHVSKRMSERMPQDQSQVKVALQKYLGAFKGPNSAMDFSTLFADRICGDDTYGTVVRTFFLADTKYVLVEFKFVVDLFTAVETHVESLAQPPLADQPAS
jgi:hypothetical protein